jgi:hypothetical protein
VDAALEGKVAVITRALCGIGSQEGCYVYPLQRSIRSRQSASATGSTVAD